MPPCHILFDKKQVLKFTQLATFLWFIGVTVAFGQSNKVTIRGAIINAQTKEGLFGSTVVVEGTNIGSQADMEGKYSILIPAEKACVLLIRSLGYKAKTIPLSAIPAGEVRILNIELEEDIKDNKEVTVTVVRRKDTDISLIKDLKQAELVANGVSSEQITKTQDRDAAQVMSRVPGVTIIDNRFVMIRGINERYNTVMINGAISPGTEVDTRAFSFDLIASNMIERLTIYKSGSAALPGEFAGGVVKINTKNTFGDDFLNISMGSAWRPATTLQSGLRPEGSSTDFAGFDNGVRALPSSFPSTKAFQNMDARQQVEVSKMLNGNFGNNSFSNLPDLRLGLNMGKRWQIGSKKLSTVSSLAYTSTFQNINTERYRYATWDPNLNRSQDTLFQYKDQSYTQNIRISGISNWMLQTEKSKYELKTIFNQMGDNETVIREGKTAERSSDEFKNYSYNYLSRSLLSSQLVGNHEISESKKLDWVLGYSFTNRNQPDYRRVRTFRKINSNDAYQLVPAAGAGGLDETGRFFSTLQEHVSTVAANLEQTFNLPWDSAKATLRAGIYNETKSRNFDARFFAYILKNANQNQDLLIEPLDRIFSQNNLSTQKFVLQEGTRPQDAYQAQSLLSAAYAEVLIPYKKWKFTGGFRPEFNIQNLQSGTSAGPVNVSNPILSPLGFFNASYDLNNKWLVRGAYSKTINRPEFRELAPFVYYDFNLDVNFVGNSKLKVADIHNYDLRLEFYPSKSELITFGAFYKRFVNPIETKISPIGLLPQFTYDNANRADNYGIEVEIRKSFGDASQQTVWDRLFFVGNFSLIKSQVDLGVVGSQERIRSLQGQSPYVVNAGIFYTNEGGTTNFSALYNVFGKRIFMVGDGLFPTIYEMPRHVVDLSISHQIAKKVTLKTGVSDLLNYNSRFIQDSNRNGKIDSADELIFKFRRGAYYTLAFTYTI